MNKMDCAEFAELAPELALGVLNEPARSVALEHMGRCPHCQAEVATFAESADRLLELVPSRGAPDGFESRVAAAFRAAAQPVARHESRKARRGRLALSWRVASALAAAAAVGVFGFALHGAVSTSPPAQRYPAEAALLRDAAGTPTGEVLVSRTSWPWLVMLVNPSTTTGWYSCYLRTSSGRQLMVGHFQVGRDGGYWVTRLPVPTREVAGARLVGPGGGQVATATFQ